MRSYDEKQVVAQLQKAETQRRAFEEVVEHYNQPLYWHIRRMVNSHEDANDVLQNAFIKAWVNIDSFRGDSKLSTWHYRIAINETLTFIQKRKLTQPIDDDENGLSNQLHSDTYFDGDETEIQLQEAIAQLPEKQRVVFNLKYFEEMKYDEMSKILDTSVGALKASYHFAVKKITDFFDTLD